MIRRVNGDENWRKLFGSKNTRLKDEELILRFMAMLKRSDEYSRPMRDFLNQFTADFSGSSEAELMALEACFREVTQLIWEAKAKDAFRPSRALNAAVCESVMLGLAKRLQSGKGKPLGQAVQQAYDRLTARPDYMRACERATADDETVKLRQALSVAAFAEA